jgi:hypothetical protein
LLKWEKFTKIVDDGTVATFSVTSRDGTAAFNFTITRSDCDQQEVAPAPVLGGGDESDQQEVAPAPVLGGGNESTVVTSRAAVSQGDTCLTANKMKIDFELTNFPWMEPDDTYVALISKVESKRKIKIDKEDQPEDGVGSRIKGPPMVKDVRIDFEDTVDTFEFTPFGEYSWLDSAVAADGNGTVTIAVVATSPPSSDSPPGNKDDMRDWIAFSFVGEGAHSDYIYWDPEAGIGYAASGGSVICVTAGVVVTLITMFFV